MSMLSPEEQEQMTFYLSPTEYDEYVYMQAQCNPLGEERAAEILQNKKLIVEMHSLLKTLSKEPMSNEMNKLFALKLFRDIWEFDDLPTNWPDHFGETMFGNTGFEVWLLLNNALESASLLSDEDRKRIETSFPNISKIVRLEMENIWDILEALEENERERTSRTNNHQ